jgi:hypothetical protein
MDLDSSCIGILVSIRIKGTEVGLSQSVEKGIMERFEIVRTHQADN